MNISKISDCISKGDMSKETTRYLINCRAEIDHLDYKIELKLDTDFGISSFAKDMLGMKNIGGGYIVVGVKDMTWEPVGIENKMKIDSKQLRDKVVKASGISLDINIVHHDIYIKNKKRTFALIMVRASAKRNKLKAPSVAAKDFRKNEKWGIRKGDIFLRHGDSTRKLQSQNELNDLLMDLEARYSEDNMKHESSEPSPYAVESGLYRLLPKGYDFFVGRENYKTKVMSALESDPRIWIINLYGPGGVGKSAIATWAAYEYYENSEHFEAILHLSAKDRKLEIGRGIQRLQPTLFSFEDFLDKILLLFEHGEYCSKNIEERKKIVTEILSAYKTLIILDNMETVADGRIMQYIRTLPPTNMSKALLTSRRRSSEWELPLQVREFDFEETREYIAVKAEEMNLKPEITDNKSVKRIQEISGGLPLAVQWILGECIITGELSEILERAVNNSSPLLEFSFRNSWEALDNCSKEALAVLSIFDEPPTVVDWRIALDRTIESLEKSIESLQKMTFIAEVTDDETGKNCYSALPITLTFARNELSKMGSIELSSRRRYNRYRDKIDIEIEESAQYRDLYSRYDARQDNQKRAIVLARMAEGYAKSYKFDLAKKMYEKALDSDPRSVFALVSFGLHLADLGQHGAALEKMEEAKSLLTKNTGLHIYYNLAKVYEQIGDKKKRMRSLRKALEYKPDDRVIKHSLGVILSRLHRYEEALRIFDEIINAELNLETGPTESLTYAYCTKIITLEKSGNLVSAKAIAEEAKKSLEKHNIDASPIHRQLAKYM